jgi:hypothetical protein
MRQLYETDVTAVPSSQVLTAPEIFSTGTRLHTTGCKRRQRARAQLCEPITSYITYDAFWPPSIRISVQLASRILALNYSEI